MTIPIYALALDADRRVIGRFISTVHDTIPADAVHVDVDTWQRSMSMDRPRLNPDRSLSEVPRTPNLEAERAAALMDIDMAAGAARARYITVTAGQELTYQRKSTEVAAWLSASTPNPLDYPMLAAEAEACALSLADVVAEAMAAEETWVAVGAAIEGQRMAGKRAVRAASALPAITAARNAAIDAINTL